MSLGVRESYDILGLTPRASIDDIKKKYYSLAKIFHPDRATDLDKEFSKAFFIRVNNAYQTLLNNTRLSQNIDELTRKIKVDTYKRHIEKERKKPKKEKPKRDIRFEKWLEKMRYENRKTQYYKRKHKKFNNARNDPKQQRL